MVADDRMTEIQKVLLVNTRVKKLPLIIEEPKVSLIIEGIEHHCPLQLTIMKVEKCCWYRHMNPLGIFNWPHFHILQIP